MMTYKKENTKKTYEDVLMLILITFLAFIVSLSLHSNPFSEFLPGHDSSMFQYFGKAMDNGKMIYTEIFDHKGPMIFIINYIGTILSTRYFHGIYIIELLSLFVYFIYSYKILRLWLPKLISFISIIPQGIILMHYLEGGNLTEEYALPFLAISLYIFVKYFIDSNAINNIEIITLGISCAIVFSLRANMIVLWLVFCFIIFIKTFFSKQYKVLLNYSLFFILGLILVFLPLALYLYINKALNEAVFQSLIFNIMYLNETNNKSEAILSLYSSLSNDYVVLIFALFLSYVILKWKNANRNERYFYISIILFYISSFMTTILSGRAYRHYLMTMIPTMTVPIALLVNLIKQKVSTFKIALVAAIFLCVIYYSQIENRFNDVYAINISVNQINKDNLDKREQKIINKANEKEEIKKIARIVRDNSNPSDTIYTHKLAGNLYLYSNRLSSIKYFNLPSVNINENPDIGKDFLAEISRANTELIILGSNYNNSEKTGYDKEFFDYIINNYYLISEENNYYIYKRIS